MAQNSFFYLFILVPISLFLLLLITSSLKSATTSILTMATTTAHPHIEGEDSLFAWSDQKVLDQICSTHVHTDKSFDEDSIFVIVENILNHATLIVDKLVQGSQFHAENIEERNPKPKYILPLCKLKQISSELSCKPPGEVTAHKTTLSILNKLQTYSWEAKAVLTLAAFAMEFGDFWLLADQQESDQLAKSLATLKGVSVLVKSANIQKNRQEVIQLNELIKTTMKVIAIFDEFEKISLKYDSKDVPGLTRALHQLPVDVYWSILSVVACSTKIYTLTCDVKKECDLVQYMQKARYILRKREAQLEICRTQIAVSESYRWLRKIFQTPTEIKEVFKAFIFTSNKLDQRPTLIDVYKKKTVEIEVIKEKYVLLYISGLDISNDDMTVLKPVFDDPNKDNRYEIVWVPIVEEGTDMKKADVYKKFNHLGASKSWYAVENFSPSAGLLKFIKEEWRYNGKPTVVVVSPQGKVETVNALHLISVWGMEAFPFNEEVEMAMSKKPNWLSPLVGYIDSSIPALISSEEKYILFYGSKDNDWIQKFSNKAKALENNPVIKDTLKTIIKSFPVLGKTEKVGDDVSMLWRFWTSIESLFFIKVHHQQANHVTKEIQKLLSYKNESSWAVLSKGNTVVVAGPGLTFLKVLEEFDKWKDVAKEKGFEIAIKEHYSKAIEPGRCCHFDLRSVSGKVPETVECPECHRTMEAIIRYKCCHK